MSTPCVVRFAPSSTRSRLLLLAAVVSLPAAQVRLVGAEPPTQPSHVWLDVEGQKLPFQDDDTIRDVLRSARVVSRTELDRGVAGVERFVLEHDNTRFHAAWRSVDRNEKELSPGSRRPKRYRDAAVFECAAYELSELLGLRRVPPTVQRRVGTQEGTLQIWLEGTSGEDELSARDEMQPPDVKRWLRQKQVMYVFDNLISNADRNQGNIMIDGNWTIWFIDHSRAFERSSRLPYSKKVTACERRLWTSLRELDEDTVRQRLEPFLEGKEISTLLSRREKLIDHIQKLIDKKGEDAVLFDLQPPRVER